MRKLGTPAARGRLVALMVAAALAATALGAFAVAAGARSPATPVLINQAFQFRPGTLHVRAGTRVEFENESSYTHTATDAGVFDTGKIKPGATKLVNLTKRGTFVFHCTIHPFMTGKVVVE
jgi:plastocyanin